MKLNQEPFKVHPSFRFNNIPCDEDTLFEIGYSYIKEGWEFEQTVGDFLINWLSEDPEIIVKTSGSTGSPKRISLKKSSMVQSALATAKFLDLPPGTTALCCLSAGNIAGKMMLVRAMVMGWDLYLVAPSSTPLAGLNRSFDFGAMVPLQLRNSMAQLEQLKTIIVGGAAFPADLEERLGDIRTAIYETYGMTETASHVAMRRIRTRTVRADNIEDEVFSGLPGITFSTDERGCLVIDAQGLTSEKVVTNDLVKIISDTSFKWLGRWDNVINSGGVKLIAEELEKKFSNYLNNRIILLGIPDDTLGEKALLVIEGEVDKTEIFETLRGQPDLHPYEVPKKIIALDKFPLTENGKIMRAKIEEEVIEKLKHSG